MLRLSLALVALAASTLAQGTGWVRVVDAESGEPVSAARVEPRSARMIGTSRVGDSNPIAVDSDGLVELTRMQDLYWLEAPGYSPASFLPESARPDAENPLVIRLRRPGSIRLTVTDGLGEPQPGVPVTVSCPSYSLLQAHPLTRFARGLEWQAATDAEGRVVFEELPPEAPLKVEMLAPQANGRPRTVSVFEHLVLAPGEAFEHTRDALRARRVQGRVLDALGQPVSGIQVGLQRARFARSWIAAGGERTTTDDEGQFVFEGVLPGKVSVGLSPSRGLAPAQPLSVPPEAPMDPIELRHTGAATLGGHVQSPDGEHVPEAWIRVQGLLPGGTRMSLRADSRGRFHIEHLPPGAYQLSVQRNSLGFGSVEAEAGDRGIVVQLSPCGGLKGDVHDVHGGESAVEEVDLFGDASMGMSFSRAQGRYSQTSLRPGTYHAVAVRADGQIGVSESVVVQAEKVTQVSPITLRPGGLVTVHAPGRGDYEPFAMYVDGVQVAGDNYLRGTRITHPAPPGEVRVTLGKDDQQRERRLTLKPGETATVVFD